MSTVPQRRNVDREFYEERLRDFLPDRIIDIHTHVWMDAFTERDEERDERVVSWPALVARDNPFEDLRETYEMMFPGKEVTPLVFTTLSMDLDRANDYCARGGQDFGWPALIFARPEWSGEELEHRIRAGGFAGVKSYLTLTPSYLPRDEVRIFDFFPPHQMDVLNANGWIAMVHIPRSGRLKDPVNLAQLCEIDKRWPNLKCVVAHVGRAYCPEDVGDALDILARTENLLFDISANTNAHVFEQLIRAVGPRRILFGSDLPVTRMLMRRICEDGRYINIVPPGLYGDVSADPNMREAPAEEADKLTFFLYEEIDAFRRAAEACALSPEDTERIFHTNALQILP